MKFSCSSGTISVTTSAMTDLTTFLKQRPTPYSGIAVIADKTVFNLYGKELMELLKGLKLPAFESIIEPGESSKSLSTVESCWNAMRDHGLDRSSLVIGFGGGVVTDIAGFAASSYMRGIDLVHIPTSLLAMADASIGGKNGVNLTSGKNIVGSIYQPRQVIISLDYLTTLPTKELSAGLAEVIKCGVIGDPSLFEYLEQNIADILCLDKEKLTSIVQSTATFKASIVNSDEKEKNLRAILNYGHTFGHAIESASNYAITHGEAVSIGMCCAANASHLLGMVDAAFIKRQNAICLKAGLPTVLPASLDNDKLIDLMYGDKKATKGKISLILVEGLGKVKQVDSVKTDIIREAFQAARQAP